MIKILIAGSYPVDSNKLFGGPSYTAYLHSQTLAERSDVSVEAITRSQDTQRNESVEIEGIRVHLVAEPATRLIPRQYTMVSKVAEVMSTLTPDIVVAQNRIEALAAVSAGLPLVYIRHGITKHETRIAHGFSKLVGFLGDRVERKALAQVRDLICISDYGISASRGETKARIHKINYPVLADSCYEYEPYEAQKGVLFAGAVTPLKNLLTILDGWPTVLSASPEARLRVCGRTSDSVYLAETKARIASLGIGESVELRGLVGQQELMELMRDSSCLVLPSFQENMPNVVAQAMAAGRPVIAAPVGGVPEMVDDGTTGFLVGPDDAAGFSNRINQLLSNPALTRQMGEAGRQAALTRFERHAHIDQLLEICKKAIAHQSKG